MKVRMIFIGYIEDISSQRGMAWRCEGSRSLPDLPSFISIARISDGIAWGATVNARNHNGSFDGDYDSLTWQVRDFVGRWSTRDLFDQDIHETRMRLASQPGYRAIYIIRNNALFVLTVRAGDRDRWRGENTAIDDR